MNTSPYIPATPVHTPAAPAGLLAALPGRVQRLAAIGQCLLQHLETPLIVADAHGRVLESNGSATRRMDQCEGLWLDATGRLAVRQGGRWVPVTKWLPELAAGRSVTLVLEAEGTPMQLVLKPMVLGASAPAAALPGLGGGELFWALATVERVTLTRADAMRRRFHFTRTQARLAEMLCQGMAPVQAAELMGVKISTVRTHVGEMYEKTGTHSQAQLVALLHAC